MKPYIHTEDKAEYKGYDIRLENDDDCYNPREDCDNFGTMVCWHSRYNLGDEQPKCDPGEYLTELVPSKVFFAIEERERRAYNNRKQWDSSGGRLSNDAYQRIMDKCEEARKKLTTDWIAKNLVILDLFLYDHSGITMSTGAFSCPWDSGRVGFIYCTLDDARENWMLPETATWDTELDDWNDKGEKTGTKISLRKASARLMESEVETYDDYLTGNVWCFFVSKDGDDLANCSGYIGDWGKAEAMKDAEGEIDSIIRQLRKAHLEKAKTWIKNKVPLKNRTACPV